MLFLATTHMNTCTPAQKFPFTGHVALFAAKAANRASRGTQIFSAARRAASVPGELQLYLPNVDQTAYRQCDAA